jgi:hypothetical protein
MLSLDDIERLPLDTYLSQHIMGEVREDEVEDTSDDEGLRCCQVNSKGMIVEV